MPWFFIQLRYMKPFLSWVPNHWAERRVGFFFVSDMYSSSLFYGCGRLPVPLSDEEY
jgi:hypothetical protein